jgi:hypothetical protein
MLYRAVVFAVFLGMGAGGLAWADDVSDQIDAGRTAYARGDVLHALSQLQAAAALINARLSDQFAKLMPPSPAGWEAGAPETQPLDSIGGGLTVTRSYQNGDATLNATLIVDNPAVAGSVALFQSADQVVTQPGWSRLKIGDEQALLRFDPSTRSGEVVMVIGERAVLQIEGNELAQDAPLVETARGWNVAGLRKLLGSS